MDSTDPTQDLSHMRQEYEHPPLQDHELPDSPWQLFETWYQQAVRAKLLEPNAMVLSTATPDGRPAQRTVLLKMYDPEGFVFFTNYNSRKARQIGENPYVSLLFQWMPLARQVEISGQARKVPLSESVRYFATRPRGSQLGAWVSEQSSIVSSRSLLEAKWDELKRKFAGGEVPLPSFWGGYRVAPQRFEFWQGQPNRLHDRFEYLCDRDSSWSRHRLAP